MLKLNPQPNTMPRWEALLTRFLLAWFLWRTLGYGLPPWKEQPHPVGLGQFHDFTWLSDPHTFFIFAVSAMAGIILYAIGFLAPIGLLAFLAFDISIHTLASSQGVQGHGGQLNALMALGLLIGLLWAIVSKGKGWRSLFLTSSESDQQSIKAARIMLAAVYVVAGLSKLQAGGFDWPFRGEAFVLQILKCQDELRFSHIDSPLTDSAIRMGEYLVQHPKVASAMLLTGLLLELGAFIACFGRLPALIIGLGLLAFHISNEWLMGLPFRGNQQMVILLFIQPFYWLAKILPFTRKTLPAVDKKPLSPQAWLQHPAMISMVIGFFLLWRQEWYPFSNFPMYSVLPPRANTYYTTDLQDNIIPLAKLGTNAPTLKKAINTELQGYKTRKEIRRFSDLSVEQLNASIMVVVDRMMSIPNHRIHQHQGFRIYGRDYTTKDGELTVTSTLLAEFPPPPAD